MSKYLPDFLLNDLIIKGLHDEFIREGEAVREAVEDLINQCFVDTATWGLDRWEQFVGIETDKSKPIEERRERIKAKLRGSGTVTKQLIKDVAEAFAGEVDIIEDFQNGQFTIKFIGTRGIPKNMNDFMDSIYKIKPAHLGVLYESTYLIFNELDTVVWNKVDAMTWDELETTRF